MSCTQQDVLPDSDVFSCAADHDLLVLSVQFSAVVIQ